MKNTKKMVKTLQEAKEVFKNAGYVTDMDKTPTEWIAEIDNAILTNDVVSMEVIIDGFNLGLTKDYIKCKNASPQAFKGRNGK